TAQAERDTALLLQGHTTLGIVLQFTGALAGSLEHLERAAALYEPDRDGGLMYLYGLDPGVASLSFSSIPLWHLGYPDRALARSREALALARRSAHTFSILYAIDNVARIHQLRREGPAVQEQTDTFAALAVQHGFTHRLAPANFMHGWALLD